MPEAEVLYAKIGSDTTQYQASMNAAGAATDRTAARAAEMVREMDVLSQRIDFQQRGLEILQQRLDATTKKYGENSVQVAAAKLRIDQSSASIERNKATLDALTSGQITSANSIKDLANRIEALTTTQGQLNTQLDAARAKYGAESAESKTLEGALQQLNTTLQQNKEVAATASAAAEKLRISFEQQQATTSGTAAHVQAYDAVVDKAGLRAVDAAVKIEQLTQRIEAQQRSLPALQQQLVAVTREHGADSTAAQALQMRIDKLTTSINNNKASLERQEVAAKLSGQSMSAADEFAQSFTSGLAGMVGPAAAATAALGAASTVAESFKDAFAWQAEMDAATTSINIQLKGVRDANEVWAQAAEFGEKYRYTQEQMTTIISNSVPLLRQSKAGFDDLAGVLARMQVLAPGKSIEEAAFSLRELASGDIVSMADQFNIAKNKVYEMRDAIVAGGDPIVVMAEYLDKAGVSMDTLKARTEGAKGAMNDLVLQQEDLKEAQAEWAEGPGLQLLELQTNVIRGLVRVMTGDWSPAIESGKNALAGWAADQAGWVTDLVHWGDEQGKAAAKAETHAAVLGLLGGQTQQAAEATQGMAAATDQAAGSATNFLGKVGPTAEELAKLGKELESTGDKAAEGFKKIEEAQGKYQRESQERSAEHEAKLDEIQRDAQGKRTQEDGDFYDRIMGFYTDYARRREEIERDGAQKLADIDAKHQDDMQAMAESHVEALNAITQKQYDAQEAYAAAAAQSERDYQEEIAGIQSDAAAKRAEDEQKYNDDRAAAAQDLADKLAGINQDIADDAEQAQRDALARAQDYADKLADINQQAADRNTDRDQEYADDRADAEQDHQDKLADLQRQLSGELTDEQRARIEQQIADENRAYAEKEARAERDYQQQVERDARELAQAQAKAERERQQAEDAAAQKLADQQRQHEREIAAAQQAEQRKQEELRQSYDQQQQDLIAATAAKLATSQQQYDREKADRAQKLADELADLQQSVAQEQASYAKKQEQSAAHYVEEVTKQRTTLLQQIADAGQAFQRQQDDQLASFNKQKEQTDAAYAQKLADADTTYAAQSEKARAAYEEQLGDLRAGLGEQLDAYTTLQQQMTKLSADEAAKRRAIIAAEFGYDQAKDQQQFQTQINGLGLGDYGGAATGALLGGTAGVVPPGFGAGGGGGNIVINVSGAQNPQAVAQAVREELLKINRHNNGGALIP